MKRNQDVITALLGGNDEPFDKIVEHMYKNRTIVLNNEIDKNTLEYATEYIVKWNKEDKGLPVEDRKPIKLHIATYGGVVITGFNLIDVIEQSKTPVWGIVMDCAYSMGGLILLACHRRIGFKNSTILLHDGSTGAYTSTSKMRDIMEFTNKQEDRIKNFVLGNTSISEELYEKKYGAEWFMYSDEAKDLAILSEIVGEDVEMDEIL